MTAYIPVEGKVLVIVQEVVGVHAEETIIESNLPRKDRSRSKDEIMLKKRYSLSTCIWIAKFVYLFLNWSYLSGLIQ